MDQEERKLPELEGDRVRLRLGRDDDAPAIVAYFRDNLERLRGSMPRPAPTLLTEAHWREQTARSLEDFRADRAVRLFVFLKESEGRGAGDVAGTVNFTQIARGPARSCVLGYGIAGGLEGKGYMTEALRLALAYAFGPLGLHRVSANYRPTNARSGRLLRKLGFVVEGYARDYLFLDGAWQDHLLTSLTNPAAHAGASPDGRAP